LEFLSAKSLVRRAVWSVSFKTERHGFESHPGHGTLAYPHSRPTARRTRGLTVADRKKAIAARFARAVKAEIPNQAGLAAWLAFLGAHASLMRRLDADLLRQTGARLNEFDVLAVLAGAGGTLRMTELAERAYASRSGMTRRVDNLVDRGLLRRGSHDADGRAVVIELTGAGVKRLEQLAPVHARAVMELFVSQMTASDLRALSRALAKVSEATTYG